MKTINVNEIVEMANAFFQNSTDHLIDERKAVAEFVSNILHKTKNYQGFGYLESESDLHAGHYGKDGRVFFYKK